MLENVAEMLEDMRPMMKKLNKELYASRMEEHLQRYGHYYEEMLAYAETAENPQRAREEVADCWIASVKGRYEKAGRGGKPGKIPGAVRGDIDLFHMFYFFPGLLKTEGSGQMELADVICTRWNEAVGSNLSYADYNTLYNGFRERFLGLFRI